MKAEYLQAWGANWHQKVQVFNPRPGAIALGTSQQKVHFHKRENSGPRHSLGQNKPYISCWPFQNHRLPFLFTLCSLILLGEYHVNLLLATDLQIVICQRCHLKRAREAQKGLASFILWKIYLISFEWNLQVKKKSQSFFLLLFRGR